jgi:protein-S-isoprenylcysteine O-methyltransferase Ste14
MAIALLTLALVGTVSLAATTLLGHQTLDAAGVRQHFLLALGTTTLLVLAHSSIMFFLIATGVEMKELEKQRGWGDSFRRRTVGMKSKVFPAATLALLLVIASFVLGAAAHTRALPGWTHGLTGWVTLGVCVLALAREYRALGENNRLIAEVARRRSHEEV